MSIRFKKKGSSYEPEINIDCLFNKNGFCFLFDRALAHTAAKTILAIDRAKELRYVTKVEAYDCIIVNGYMDSIHEFKMHPQKLHAKQMRCTDTRTRDAEKRKKVSKAKSALAWKPLLPNQKPQLIQWSENAWGASSLELRQRETCWFWESTDMRRASFDFKALLKEEGNYPRRIPFVAECVLNKPWKPVIPPDVVGDWWVQLFGDAWLPWDKTERRNRFPQAYQQLRHYFPD